MCINGSRDVIIGYSIHLICGHRRDYISKDWRKIGLHNEEYYYGGDIFVI
jgi:hypothetical protein